MARKSSRSREARLRNLGYAGLGALALATIGVVGSVALTPPPEPPVSAKVAAAYEAGSTLTPPTTPPVSTFKAEDARALLASGKNLVVSVAGDSTGNSKGEWVDLWAQHLGASATVTVHMWDETAKSWIPTPVTYGQGTRTIEIWNGSQPGAPVDFGLEHLDAFEPVKPDLLLMSYGHNQGSVPIDGGLYEMAQKTNAKWGAQVPAVVIIQNPAQADRAVLSATAQARIRGWATSAGYPVVDVASAFAAHPPLSALLRDALHPNDAGSRIWADTVIAAVG